MYESRPSERLEREAERVVARFRKHDQDLAEVDAILASDLELTLAHLHRNQDSLHKHLTSLLWQECYVDTELHQAAQRWAEPSDADRSRIDTLHNQLADIEKDRRKTMRNHRQERQALLDRLHEQLKRHAQLRDHDD